MHLQPLVDRLLSAETGEQLPPRAVLLVFTDQDSMAAGERVLGGIYSAVREPRAGYTWLNTVWLDDSMHPWPGARAQAVAHEFSHLFAAFTARGKAIPSWFDERLAVDSEITLPRDDFAVVSDAQATYEQGLEYAQAYMTVEAALERGGRPAAWRALHAMGDEGLDFPSAFESAFGLSVDDLDAHAGAAWQSQLL